LAGKLAAAVTNAGGIGVIGGVGYTPEMLKEQVSNSFSVQFSIQHTN
jgi:NAD(P)H-dependent flavin oxidoreductase YrpB (nitropropane dioxygenase family)